MSFISLYQPSSRHAPWFLSPCLPFPSFSPQLLSDNYFICFLVAYQSLWWFWLHYLFSKLEHYFYFIFMLISIARANIFTQRIIKLAIYILVSWFTPASQPLERYILAISLFSLFRARLRQLASRFATLLPRFMFHHNTTPPNLTFHFSQSPTPPLLYALYRHLFLSWAFTGTRFAIIALGDIHMSFSWVLHGPMTSFERFSSERFQAILIRVIFYNLISRGRSIKLDAAAFGLQIMHYLHATLPSFNIVNFNERYVYEIFRQLSRWFRSGERQR